MKKPMNLILGGLSLSLFLSMGLLVGCGKNKEGVSSPAPPPVTPPQTINQCEVGQIYSTEYGCLYRGGCEKRNEGIVDDQDSDMYGKCVAGELVDYADVFGTATVQQWGATLNITNAEVFERFLKEIAQVCEPPGYIHIIGFNPYDCANYSGQGALIVHTDSINPSLVTVRLVAGAPAPSEHLGSGYYPFYTELSSEGNYYTTDSSNDGKDNPDGFEIWAKGFPGSVTFGGLSNKGLKIMAPQGTFLDSQIEVSLAYDGEIFARTTIEKL